MSYITESILHDYTRDYVKKRYYRGNVVLQKSSAQKTIFLSHSHKDKILAEGLIDYLATLGIKVYVDWNDSGMPRITDRTTANRIKEKIKENTFFLILASENAMTSRWVPWEIGVADQIKDANKMAIVPVVKNNDDEFKGNEYLQLYRRIILDEIGKDRIKLYEVGSYRSHHVKNWLN